MNTRGIWLGDDQTTKQACRWWFLTLQFAITEEHDGGVNGARRLIDVTTMVATRVLRRIMGKIVFLCGGDSDSMTNQIIAASPGLCVLSMMMCIGHRFECQDFSETLGFFAYDTSTQ